MIKKFFEQQQKAQVWPYAFLCVCFFSPFLFFFFFSRTFVGDEHEIDVGQGWTKSNRTTHRQKNREELGLRPTTRPTFCKSGNLIFFFLNSLVSSPVPLTKKHNANWLYIRALCVCVCVCASPSSKSQDCSCVC